MTETFPGPVANETVVAALRVSGRRGLLPCADFPSEAVEVEIAGGLPTQATG